MGSRGLEIIKEAEGYRGDAYVCAGGVITIGYGLTKDVRMGDHVTPEKAELLLMEDVQWAEKVVNRLPVPLRQCQFDALVSLVFNVGSGNFEKSTLRKMVLRDPNDAAIAAEFKKWNKAGGKVLPGLVSRRAAEADLYFSVW